mgnify:CR=1 FL=1
MSKLFSKSKSLNESINSKSRDAFIQIEGISKTFNGTNAVKNVNLNIHKGELFTILGGSGCGKSTLLKIIAGLEIPDQGSVVIDGIDMSNIPANERPINMMFQSYAVFPHMNVFQNIAYGLKKENIPKSVIEDKVAAMIKLVQLDNLDNRMPNELSGGQLQRVALGRALVKQPKVLLLDEPLAALDKKLREQTQFELMNLQSELNMTFIVVTHDQEEAMTLSSRIALMNKGEFIQIGSPSQIYETPINRYPADFFGSINFFDGEIISQDQKTKKTIAKLQSCNSFIYGQSNQQFDTKDAVIIGVRPENIILQDADQSDLYLGLGTIQRHEDLGHEIIAQLMTESGLLLTVRTDGKIRHQNSLGDKVPISVSLNNVHAFSAEAGKRLT